MWNYDKECNVNVLVGKVLTNVIGSSGDDTIRFIVSDDESYLMYHGQDCCERVRIEDICGDINDLVGFEILEAEEVSNNETEPYAGCESYTWTFYKIRTIKGGVTIRWLGESNGYYSESVSFCREQ